MIKKISAILFTIGILITICSFSVSADESDSLPYSETIPILTVYPNRNTIEIYSEFYEGLRFELEDGIESEKKIQYAEQYKMPVIMTYSEIAQKITVTGYIYEDKFYEQSLNISILPTVKFSVGGSDNPNHVKYVIDNVVSPIEIVMGGCREPFSQVVSEKLESEYVCIFTIWNAKATITLTPQVAIVYTFEGDGRYTPESRIHFSLNYEPNEIIGMVNGNPATKSNIWILNGYADNTSYLTYSCEFMNVANVAYNPTTGEFNATVSLICEETHITLKFNGTNNDYQEYTFTVVHVEDEADLDPAVSSTESTTSGSAEQTSPAEEDPQNRSKTTVIITMIVCVIIVAGALILAKYRKQI